MVEQDKTRSGESSESAPGAQETSSQPGNGSKLGSAGPAAQPPQQPHKKQLSQHVTWERSIEILKLVATVWVAGVGTIVTMQFNERQHELARIEAIAKMLPHLSASTIEPEKKAQSESDRRTGAAGGAASSPAVVASAGSKSNKTPASLSAAIAAATAPAPKGKTQSDMSKDGAIWAIFRTANNKMMLRDLASLFPEDIYRVVSSIAVAGGLEHDEDALTALQVASEKLASKYTDAGRTELAGRLYNQAVRLKERRRGESVPIYIVDLADPEVDSVQTDEHTHSLIMSLNRLGSLHLQDSDKAHRINASHWQAKQLFKRARQIGIGEDDNEDKVEAARADVGLSKIYSKEGHEKLAEMYLKEALKIEEETLGKDNPETVSTQKMLNDLKNHGPQSTESKD